MTNLHIVIPVFNGWEQTEICLNALRASSYRDYEIIIVDHGSTDATKKALPTQYPEVVHVLGEPTLWWTGATNLGIRTATDRGAGTIMLLNNDCYVTPETIERLMAHGQRARGAIIAPVQRDYLSKHVLCTTATTCFLLGFPTVIPPGGARDHLGKEQLLPTNLILGGRGVMIPADVFQRVGMLDEVHLPHYGSDNDFYLRCREAGISLFIAPDSAVEMDQRTTTQASTLGQMDFRKFLNTLTDRRSHRNLRDLTALFKRHYPIKGLHHIGVTLNLLRYFLMFGWERMRCALKLS